MKKFSAADADGNGQVSFEELKAWAIKQPPESVSGGLGKASLKEVFDDMDKDRNGNISLAESGCLQGSPKGGYNGPSGK
ncbi:MAG TPA: EF-hand domain-containing protein [Thermoanaerobaculia bacterium]|nr:EF-hand domain-containing protein [Thermoanaerobaculia bacterium]